MSSVVESIFFDEEIVKEESSKNKSRVSWGDMDDGELVTTRIITQTSENSEEMSAETSTIETIPRNRDVSYMPKTPNLQVCSEELDLHWSDSGDEQENQDVFMDDTMSGSFLDHALSEGGNVTKNCQKSTSFEQTNRDSSVNVVIKSTEDVKDVAKELKDDLSIGFLQ